MFTANNTSSGFALQYARILLILACYRSGSVTCHPVRTFTSEVLAFGLCFSSAENSNLLNRMHPPNIVTAEKNIYCFSWELFICQRIFMIFPWNFFQPFIDSHIHYSLFPKRGNLFFLLWAQLNIVGLKVQLKY